MNERTLRALVEAGAIKRVCVIASGSIFHLEAVTKTGAMKATTIKGSLKTWRTLDAAARWIHGIGLGQAQLNLEQWQPRQKGLKL